MIINGKILGDIVASARDAFIIWLWTRSVMRCEARVSFEYASSSIGACVLLFDMIDICYVVYELRWQQLNSADAPWMDWTGVDLFFYVVLRSLINFLCKHTLHPCSTPIHSFVFSVSPGRERYVAWQSIVHHRETGYWWDREWMVVRFGFRVSIRA